MPDNLHKCFQWQMLSLLAAILIVSVSTGHAVAQCLPGETCHRPTNAKVSAVAPSQLSKKQNAIEQAIGEGNKARDENKYEQALSHFSRAQTLNPREARAYYSLGNLYFDFLC